MLGTAQSFYGPEPENINSLNCNIVQFLNVIWIMSQQ